MRLDYKEIQLLVQLETKFGERDQTCFDHVVSIGYEADQWQVEVFVEPYGKVLLSHPDLSRLLRFWITVFESQPQDWEFARAGWHLGLHLANLQWSEPEDAPKIWEIPE